MADEEQKYFSLTEAERLRKDLEPVLIEAMEARRKLADAETKLSALAERIQRSGGMMISFDSTARLRLDRNQQEDFIREAIDRIHSTGCLVKDLEVGLLDFPARINDEDVYLCWKLGEDRIRFYHRQDEGFAGRKPIDPRDTDYRTPIQ
ncbi:MAG TPA: DUF2203 domain-containing protein [Verrucomicrobiae bacterium]|nr:DUF2203 domain-containing protein [Verrucomicrobiae bacterium]